MKALAILILCVFAATAATIPYALVSSKKPAAGGGACSTTHAQNAGAETGQVTISGSTATYYVGLGQYNPGANISVCKVDFILSLGGGDISGKTLNCVISSMSGNDFTGGLLGTSDGVTGNNSWSGTTVSFTFASPVAISSGGSYAIALTANGVDAANYARYSFSASGGISGSRFAWDSSGVYSTGFGTDDPRITIYK